MIQHKNMERVRGGVLANKEWKGLAEVVDLTKNRRWRAVVIDLT